MTPDTAETRLGRLEREMAALQQQVKDVVHDVEQLAPIRESVARVEERLVQVQAAVVELRETIGADRKAAKERGAELAGELKDMRDEAAAQARANKTQLIAAVVSIITTLLIVAGTIVAAGMTG